MTPDRDHTAALDRLILLSGGVQNLAQLLGVPASTVYRWQQDGRVSKRGFFLACFSSLIPVDLVRGLMKHDEIPTASAENVTPLTALAMVEQEKFEEKIANGAAHTIPFLAERKAM